MSISPYHDLETPKPHPRGQRAYWGGLGMVLVGLLAIISHFAFPASETPASAVPPIATNAAVAR